jgi:hypothetical protein
MCKPKFAVFLKKPGVEASANAIKHSQDGPLSVLV